MTTVQAKFRELTERLSHHASMTAWPLGEREHQARGEALTLIAHVLQQSTSRLLASLPDPFPPAHDAELERLVRGRLAGQPLQYVTGVAHFYGREFHVAEGVLIPRPDTEILVEAASTYLKGYSHARVFEFGTGSGAIAISLKLECPDADVTTVDVSNVAVAIAAENAKALDADVEFLHEDGFAALQKRRGAIDVLVSNPPYIPSRDVDELDEDVRLHEPRLALDGGADGLDFYHRLMMPEVFPETGPAAFFFEVGIGQADVLVDMWRQRDPLGPGWTYGSIDDLRGIGRVVYGIRE